jgi:AAA+ ATPase superfamily predicted ATPase
MVANFKLVGRQREVLYFNKALNSSVSELVAIYGRRRIGKTFLVREHLKKEIVFDMTGINGVSKSIQLRNFYKQITQLSKKAEKFSMPKDWLEAFDLLEIYLKSIKRKKKKVIFLDEFPWLCSQRSGFLSVFEYFWNNFCTKRNDIMVVVCGSAASFMVEKIIRNKSGLHGRLTRIINLKPFNLSETKEFLKKKNIKWTNYDIVQLYMALGGVPYYLNHLDRDLSVMQNIDKLCFAEGGVMVNEFDEALLSLFTNSVLHKLIINILSKKRIGLTRKELIDLTKKSDNGDFSHALKELEQSGFIAKYRAYDNKKNKILYKLYDEFCFFYLKFIKKYQGQGDGTWLKIFTKQTYKSWSGFAFESICLKHVEQIKRELGLQVMYTISSSWKNKEAQIDLVISRADNRIDLFELKFNKEPFEITKSYYHDLLNKIGQFKKACGIKKQMVSMSMITPLGVKTNKYKIDLITNDIVIDTLFKDYPDL